MGEGDVHFADVDVWDGRVEDGREGEDGVVVEFGGGEGEDVSVWDDGLGDVGTGTARGWRAGCGVGEGEPGESCEEEVGQHLVREREVSQGGCK